MTKILIIENQEKNRNVFLRYLEQKGFDSIYVENGLVVVQWAFWDLPDLIVSEISIPNLDSYSVLNTLHQNSPTGVIPLIFITSKVTWADVCKGIKLGVDDYFTKLCTPEKLFKTTTTQLKRGTLLKHSLTVNVEEKVSDLPLTNTVSFASLEPISQSIPVLREVFNFIEANYNRQISLSDVAKTVGYSPAYLTNLVRQQTGQSIYRWITHYRMTQARLLLLKTDQKMNQMAANLGYQNVNSFCRQFRKYNGKSPRMWKNQYRLFLA